MTDRRSAPATPTDDVLIVGAGLAGLPVAWELARRGARVRVIDRDGPGQATSRVAAGMLAPITEIEPDDPGHLALGREALVRWPAFAADLAEASGVALELRTRGTLALARDRDEAEALVHFQGVCERFGVPVERLLPSAARRLEPALAPTLRSALSVPDDHAIDPREVVSALVGAIELAGGRIESGVGVRRLLVAAGRAAGVALEDGRERRAGAVVLAAGPWSGGFAGVPEADRVPVRPVKGQLLVLRDPAGPGLVERVLRFGSGYLVPRDDGRYVLGATTEEQGFDRSVTAWALHDLLRDGAELVPGLLDLRVEETLAGLRPTTPDCLPVIGPSAALRDLWWASGHHRNGVLFASLTAALLADGIQGEPRAPELASLRGLVDPGRFVRAAELPDATIAGPADASGVAAGSTALADLAPDRAATNP